MENSTINIARHPKNHRSSLAVNIFAKMVIDKDGNEQELKPQKKSLKDSEDAIQEFRDAYDDEVNRYLNIKNDSKLTKLSTFLDSNRKSNLVSQNTMEKAKKRMSYKAQNPMFGKRSFSSMSRTKRSTNNSKLGHRDRSNLKTQASRIEERISRLNMSAEASKKIK